MLTKEMVDNYLAGNGWGKFIDDDDVDFFAIGDVSVVVPEERIDDYDRLLNEALATVAKFEEITVEELITKIQNYK